MLLVLFLAFCFCVPYYATVADNGTVAEILSEIGAMRKVIATLEFSASISNDPRLFLYSPAVKSKNGKHSDASDYHKKTFPKCVFCGADGGVTMAHLISEVVPDDLVSLDAFGPPTYSDELDVKSRRNFIRLCGTKGETGTCHDLFDNFRLSLLYDPANRNYIIIAVDEESPLHNKVICLSTDFPPYKRLLCWRLRQSVLRFRCHASHLPSLIHAIDYSEASSVSGDTGKSLGDSSASHSSAIV